MCVCVVNKLGRQSRASMVAQMVKNLPAMQETQVRPFESERFPREGNGHLLQYSSLEFHRQRSLVNYIPWDRKELDTTEWLTLALFTLKWHTQSKAPGKDFEVSLSPLGAGVKRSEPEQTAVGWSPPCSLHINNAIMPSVCCRTFNSLIALVQLISKRRD